MHGICEYWWGEWGMAASSRENDFVHLMASKLGERYVVDFDFKNFVEWESDHSNRVEHLSLFDPFLHRDYDLVVIQLGENIKNIDTLNTDFETMIDYIRTKISVGAEIVVVGQFWRNDAIDAIKKNVCERTGSHFVDLHDIQNVSYRIGYGEMSRVLGDDGNVHVVDHAGVAAHPNDAAMKIYAARILAACNQKLNG